MMLETFVVKTLSTVFNGIIIISCARICTFTNTVRISFPPNIAFYFTEG